MRKKCENPKKCSVGGQALLEGIMMKGPGKTVMAVRLPDGNIDLEPVPEKHVKDKMKFLGWPLIRGSVNMVESLITGYKALMRSAEKLGLEDDDEVKDSWLGRLFGDKLMSVIGGVAMVLGVVMAAALFVYLPIVLFNGLNILVSDSLYLSLNALFKGSQVAGVLDPFKAVFEGVVKILIFVGYVAATAIMKDIHRTYQYHGAEHKSIFCYEAGLELTVDNIRKQKRFHPRCGTSFLLLMLIVNILVSGVLLLCFPQLKAISWLWSLIKILLLPIICGIGYEIIRLCGKHNNLFTKIVAAPGLWLQRLTTKEPDDDMIEVAIASLKAVLPEYQEKEPEAPINLDLSDIPEVLDEEE